MRSRSLVPRLTRACAVSTESFASRRWFAARSAAMTSTGIRKSTKLRQMLESKDLRFIMEAHSGLSALIAQEAGFEGIWASGLSISAQLGVRDCNEASWTQVLEVLEFMSDASDIPILLDGDTGYGNFNNAMRLVRKLEQRGVAGVCLEDKLFPKTNSFIDVTGGQPLADAKEFALKLAACKDAQTDPDFQVVARCEAFIAGWGLDEMLERTKMYADHGADAILVHSKIADPSQIEAFMDKWDNRKPVVIVPTKYFSTPTDRFRELGISMVIWANHNMRASVKAMRNASQRIFEEQSLTGVEADDLLCSVNEVFEMTKQPQLKKAEDKYLANRS